MSSQKLVIFDLDGTLIDTVALFVEAVTAAFVEQGQEVPSENTIRSISGLGRDNGIRILAPGSNDARVLELGDAYRAAYMARASASKREELFVGAKTVLKSLFDRDDMVLAVATGKPLVGTNRVLKAHDIHPLFTSLQTPDTNIAKPHPDMIQTAMDIVSASPASTVMIGDTTHDMEMAVAAGVKALGVSWGYHQPDELNSAGADIIIDQFDTMIDAIDHLLGTADA